MNISNKSVHINNINFQGRIKNRYLKSNGPAMLTRSRSSIDEQEMLFRKHEQNEQLAKKL